MRFILFFFAFLFFSGQGNSQNLSFTTLDKSPLDVVMYRGQDQTAVARVIYSRPAKKDREIFGNLVPYGKVWRTGANEATEITFYREVMIDNKVIPAGSYSIYTIPKEDQWMFLLNLETTQWGTQYDDDKTVLRAPMNVSMAPKPIENFSIEIIEQVDGGTIFMGWDDRIASISFEFTS